jgi:guanosine-3',5'-bis(diphosphate) 3'-pyrophosphohydrolase
MRFFLCFSHTIRYYENMKEIVTPLDDILSAMTDTREPSRDLVRRAYAFAEEAHAPQKRYSGAPYFVHVSAAAKTLATLGLDATTIAAGLLHDVLEDAQVSHARIEKDFGKDVAFLVDGVTKLGKLKYRGIERHAESLRKLFISTAKDVRVILIKLADRLHNMSTLEFVPPEKRQRIALETLEIYAPLANRLSMGKLKGYLEDYAFPYAYPKEYKEVQTMVKEHTRDTEKKLVKLYRTLQKKLAEEGIKGVRGEYRLKRTYSLFKKLQKYDMDLSKIYDIAAVRVIVPSVSDCYRTLGIIHSIWRPLPGRIKDYIAFPRPNGYQSLHTTVFTGDGGVAEIQIRTEEMNREATLGIAAHYSYKESDGKPKKSRRQTAKNGKVDWVHELLEWHEHMESGEFLDTLKTDFFTDRVFVFTPKGDVVDLPTDSSPLDFAYAIHSAIGEHASAAKVNGKLVSLDTPLKNGDIVQIETKESAKPSAKWLAYTKTSMARRHIKVALQKQLEEKRKVDATR